MYRLAGLILAILIGLTACSGERNDRTAREQKTVSVVVEPVTFTSEQTRIEAVGTSRAMQSVTLTPDVAGEVVAVNFEPGQFVSKDTVLIQLDNRNQKLALDLARIRLEDAKRLYDRYQRSAGSGAVLPTVLDEAKTAYEASRIELDKAEVALDDTRIVAPFDGYVGIAEVDPGDRVGPGTTVTTIDNRQALLISFEVPEIMVGTLKGGDKIEISPWNESAAAAHGEVVDIGTRIDPVSRTFTVRASVDNTDDHLRPGMSFRVRLDVRGRSFPVIPEISVQWGSEGSHVWVVADGKARRVPATIIQRQQGRVLVDAELAEGNLVVVEGVQRMYDGIEVEYSERETPARDSVDSTVKIES